MRDTIRVLLTGAGTGASANVLRALRAVVPPLSIVGTHHDRFTLAQSLADRNYACPSPINAGPFVAAVADLVAREKIDVVIPGDDHYVKALSEGREHLSVAMLLPNPAVIALCQDKYALTRALRARGVPVPRTYPVTSLRSVGEIFARFPRRTLLWCRVRHGSRSLGATPVASPQQARTWITQWRDLRHVPVSDFTLSEYLPGRHIMMQSVWRDGGLVLAQSVEALAYFAAGNNPSGIFSLASLSKSVMAPEALEVNRRAVLAVDERASGTFFVEVKETARGIPRVTEINAGRFAAGITTLLAEGKYNMVEVFLRLALGEAVTIDDPYTFDIDRYLVRDFDTPPGICSGGDVLAAAHAQTQEVHR